MTVSVTARDLRWRKNGRELLHIDGLELPGPGIVLLAGGTGSGKTSLLKALSGALDDAHGGSVEGTVEHRIDDEPRPARVGYVPQDAQDGFLAFDAESEFELRLQIAGWTRREAVAETRLRLDQLQYTGKEKVPLSKLSGGERRRLALRAALLTKPHLLLLDEPLNHLDETWGPILFEDILAAAESSLVVAAVHEPGDWVHAAKHVVLLRGGRVHWQGDPEEFQRERPHFHELRQVPRDSFIPPPQYGGPEVVSAHGISVSRGRPLFQDVSVRFSTGLHAIVGPNGGGKTTLLRILAGLEAPAEGTVHFRGIDVKTLSGRQRARFAAVHFEDPGSAFFLPTVRQELEFQPTNAGLADFETEATGRLAASRFRLDPLLVRHPLSLSGGEQERVALACLEAANARLVLLDEPTNGLDGPGWRDLLEYLERHRRERCLVVATHDAHLIRLADSVHRLEEGRLLPLRLGSHSPLVEVRPRTRP